MLQYKKKPQLRAYLEILLSLVTISIFGVFAIKPTAITVASLLKEIEEKKATLAKTEEKIQNLHAASLVFEENKQKISLLEVAIPKKPEPDIFAKQIEGLSEKNSVQILKVSTSGGPLLGTSDAQNNNQVDPITGEAIPAPEFSLLGFSIIMQTPLGEYSSLSGFASDFLFRTRYPINIDRVIFGVQDEKEGKNLLFTVTGKIPYK